MTEIEIDISDWPDCEVGGCQNKCCRRLESPYCHPHTLLQMFWHNTHHNKEFRESLDRLFGSFGQLVPNRHEQE